MREETESKHSEEALRVSELKYRRLFETAKDGILLLDAKTGQITDVNPFLIKLLNYSRDELIGARLWEIGPFKDIKECKLAFLELQEKEYIRYESLPLESKDGLPIEVEFVSNVYGLSGGTKVIQCNIRDITRRKRAEEELQQSEERFLLAAQATRDAIWDWDIKSGRIWRNQYFWDHFGYRTKDTEHGLAGWKDLLHPEDRDRVWNGFQAALLRRSDSYEVEYRFRRADDSYAVLLDRAYIVYDETKQPIRAVGAITDLSDRRELEEQFRQAQKMESVGRLAGGVAHDFNNLLMVITAHTEIMREGLRPEDRLRKNLAAVQKAAERGASLTQQLLAFSRKQILLPRIIDLNAVVDDSVKMVRRLIGEDVELNVSLSKPLWAVKADPGQIVQVLMNLCVNARDAMRIGGELAIVTKNISIDFEAANKRPDLIPGSYAALVVNDTGTGMTKEVQARLFEPFFTTKESGRGTGLGLSTAFGIVKQSGGYIWVDSELGRGSSFTIYLPAVDAPLTTIITQEIKEAEGQGESILLVEDDEALRESMSTYLDLHGYKVLDASNGVRALHIASQYAESIQVLITDLILPKLSGVEIAREVAKISPQVVTLYMSGYTDRKLMDLDLTSPAVGFLQKPFALQSLLQKLREMISKQR
jgi:two-component system, cell cycle sensor histidine kinase and response regulator CckA